MTDRTSEARTVSVTISRPPETVYDFVADPATIPLWAFFESIAPAGDGRWTATGPGGEISTMTFAGRNEFGVLDQDVEVAPGDVVHVPLRVVPNGPGSEVLFTIFRRPEYSDDDFEADIAVVRADLARLKELCEN
jgi:hypothetical protein